MDKMVIKGGAELNGSVKVSGAKNSALKLMFASLLAEGKHVFHNVPELADVSSARKLLQSLGCESEFSQNTLVINSKTSGSHKADYELVRKMRASILCLGPLLAKTGEAIVSLPGGCAIGTRPIDLHLEAMKAMGAEIELKEGYVHAKAKKLKGNTVFFEKTTVGGTENLLMAATLAEGITTIENAAKEPEIVDLANYLNKMGARISGQGTSIIKIEGVEKLVPAKHAIMPDRIEAGTLLLAGAITGYLHVKWKILGLLAGILTMTALYSINLRIMGRPNIAILTEPTIFSFLKGSHGVLFIITIIVIITVLLLYRFLASQFGLTLRAIGINSKVSPSYGINVGRMILIGLALSNGLVALAGALFAQAHGFADISMGTGTLIAGLASIIIGESIFNRHKVWIKLISCIFGSVLYRIFIGLALNTQIAGLKASDLNLITAILVFIAMSMPQIRQKFWIKIRGNI